MRRLHARIVDYWPGSAGIRQELQRWLERLGWIVSQTDRAELESSGSCGRQVGDSCGIVACAAVNLLLAAVGQWFTINLDECIHRDHIAAARRALGLGSLGSSTVIETEQVIQLVGKRYFARFALSEAGGSGDVRDAMGALKCRVERDVAVVSLDGLLAGVLERRGGGAGASPSVYIVNTGMSSSVGQDNHWFTVALEF